MKIAIILMLIVSTPAVDYSGALEEYFDTLKVECKDDCCRRSVDAMREANGYYMPTTDTACPVEGGYRPNGLRCPTSLYWCEPTR